LSWLWILLVLPSWGVVEGGSQLEISHLARSLQPGEAVLIRAESPVPLSSMQVEAFGKAFAFYPTEDGRVWEGLVGIDLETTPDDYSLSLTGSTIGGVPVEATYSLRVLDKEFPTRRLTVEETYRTEQKGVIYEHSSANPLVQALVRDLRASLEKIRTQPDRDFPILKTTNLLDCLEVVEQDIGYHLERASERGSYLGFIKKNHPELSSRAASKGSLIQP